MQAALRIRGQRNGDFHVSHTRNRNPKLKRVYVDHLLSERKLTATSPEMPMKAPMSHHSLQQVLSVGVKDFLKYL